MRNIKIQSSLITRAEEKLYRALQQKKFRNLNRLFLVEGEKAVTELISSSYKIESILSCSETFESIPTGVCTKLQMETISTMRCAPSVIAVAEFPAPNKFEKADRSVFLLDSIRDPGNLGTMLRTARWFGAEQIILSPDCADPFNPKAVQASMGALFHLDVHQMDLVEAIAVLKQDDFEILAADTNGSPMESIDRTQKYATVIGNEGHGLSPIVLDNCDKAITISGGEISGVESLNAAISMAIIAHQLYLPSNGQ